MPLISPLMPVPQQAMTNINGNIQTDARMRKHRYCNATVIRNILLAAVIRNILHMQLIKMLKIITS